jgi:hypothetical protein
MPLRHLRAAQRRLLQRPREQQEEAELHRQPFWKQQQLLHVAALEPEVAQLVLREVVRERLGQVDAVDPAG